MKNARPSLRQIAAELDVSVATVSRALNNHPEVSPETRERILEFAARTNYRKRSPKRVACRSLGLLYPSTPVPAEAGNFEAALLTGIVGGLREQRFSLSILDAEHDRLEDESLREFADRKGVSGFLVRTPGASSALIREVAEAGVESILIADENEDERINFVVSDSNSMSARVVDHLHQLGHRRIGLVIHDVADHDHVDRFQGYKQGLERNGLAHDPELVVKVKAWSVGSGATALDTLLMRNDPPTAVYVTNPITTIGLINRCHELGIRIPDDFSIVGFDDSDARRHTYPNYTAVWQDATQMGLEAALWLTRRIEGVAERTLRKRQSTTFVVHESTGAVPAGPVRLGIDSSTLIRPS